MIPQARVRERGTLGCDTNRADFCVGISMKRIRTAATVLATLLSTGLAAGLATALSAAPSSAQGLLGVRASGVDGRVHRLGFETELKPLALVFLDPGCPIAKRYAPELGELATRAKKAGVAFYGVLSDPSLTPEDAKGFVRDFEIGFPVLFDATGDLAQRLRPTHVPEAFVINIKDHVVYRGRIDDRFADIGQARAKITKHDLRDAIDRVAASKASPPATVRTKPVGCDFESWADEAPAKVTYAQHIEPILRQHCVECHRPGAFGPFSLTNYREAKRRARMSARVVKKGLMPPWRAEAGYGHFRDERRLSAREKQLLARWVSDGAPEGDAAQQLPRPALPTTTWPLGKPDLVVPMPVEYELPAKGPDIYRYFVVKGFDEAKKIKAIAFRPGDPSVVHHVILYLDGSGEGRRLDAKDEEPGFSLPSTGGFRQSRNTYPIGGWAPGSEPRMYPRGHAMKVPAGGDLVVEIHYHLTGKKTKDRSSIGFYFAPEDEKIEHEVDGLVFGTLAIDIPAGEAKYRRAVEFRTPAPFKLIDISPHMHNLGRDVEVTAAFPSGKELKLLKIGAWDFRWQNIYVYRDPPTLPRGTIIRARWSFDNSDANPANPSLPPKRVRWGWSTTEEMCELYMSFVAADPRSSQRIQSAAYAKYMQSWRAR